MTISADMTFSDAAMGISSGMGCAEYLELERDYASAVRRWAQYAQPQNIVPPGKDQLQRATALRQEALLERNSARTPYICIASIAWRAKDKALLENAENME